MAQAARADRAAAAAAAAAGGFGDEAWHPTQRCSPEPPPSPLSRPLRANRPVYSVQPPAAMTVSKI